MRRGVAPLNRSNLKEHHPLCLYDAPGFRLLLALRDTVRSPRVAREQRLRHTRLSASPKANSRYLELGVREAKGLRYACRRRRSKVEVVYDNLVRTLALSCAESLGARRRSPKALAEGEITVAQAYTRVPRESKYRYLENPKENSQKQKIKLGKNKTNI